MRTEAGKQEEENIDNCSGAKKNWQEEDPEEIAVQTKLVV